MYELLLVIVGGGLTLSGVVLTHRYQRQQVAHAVYREKLEAIVGAIYDDSEWLDRRSTQLLFDDVQPEEFTVPINRAKMLTTLYFSSELGKELSEIHRTHLECLKWQDNV